MTNVDELQAVQSRGVEEGYGLHVQLNVPEFFKRKDFLDYIEGKEPHRACVMSWHLPGCEPTEWSDTLVLVEPCLNGEGSNSDMPEDIWECILLTLRARFGEEGQLIPPVCRERHIAVRLTNLEV
jgi:hypothetical protein